MSRNKKWPARIGLVMIVKDETEMLPRCIASIKPLISTWTICDTGSTDGTPEMVADLLGDIPGRLHHRPWVDFGHNRTEAFELARGTADYLLVFDPDMQMQIVDKPPKLRANAYSLPIKGYAFDPRLPLLTRGDLEWRYVGVVHEHLAGNGYPDVPAVPLDCWHVHQDHPAERQTKKAELYLELLTAEFSRNPANPRTVFYLAQTHAQLGNVAEAISFYRLRAEMGGWAEEAYCSRYQLGCLLSENVSFEQGAVELLRAWKERPERIESLRALANAANGVADKAPVPADGLFVHRDLYTAA